MHTVEYFGCFARAESEYLLYIHGVESDWRRVEFELIQKLCIKKV